MVHLHHSSKIKSHKEVTKQKKSRFFLLFLLDDGRIGSVLVTNGSGYGSGRPNKHTDPMDPDPDPQHWFCNYVLRKELEG
jgi:hypothetical protein